MKNNFAKYIIVAFILFISLVAGNTNEVSAQTLKEPYRESLLNGLKVLTWYEPGNPKIYIKLRVHSGGAFDPVGKTGTMALLTDSFFPELEEMKTFFEDDLGGKLDVYIDQDSITISAYGNASEYDRIIGVFQSAILTPQNTPEIVNRLKSNRLQKISDAEKNPHNIANRAVLSRLLGQYPYARPVNGETEITQKIDHIDLQFARERILKSDNATITIVGGVSDSKILRSLRQKLGSWIKSDKPIAQAFSQPNPPDAKTLIVESSGNENAEIRLAVRGVSRSDNDYAAATILGLIAQERLRSSINQTAFARHEAHVLPGFFILGASVSTDKAAQSIVTAKQIFTDLAAKEPTATEFEKAKSEMVKAFSQKINDSKSLADFYLDKDTFRIQVNPTAALKAIENLKPADIQRVAARLFNNAPFASVAVGNVTQLKDELSRNGTAIEVFGEKPIVQPKATPNNDKQKNPAQTLYLKPVDKP